MTRGEAMNRIEVLFAERGAGQYGGEAVSQLEHALQAAALARGANAPAAEVAAALLHDLGHLLHHLGEDCVDAGIDDAHEELGVRFLSKHFPPAVVEPIRLHVAAKRYLCTVESGYFSALSQASIASLNLQGGPMTAAEATLFEVHPFFREAVALRRRDDAAKVPNLPTSAFRDFLPELEQCLGL